MRARDLWIAALIAGCRTGEGSATPPEPPAAAPPLTLDHVWIVVSPGAPERELFEEAGFRIAPAVNHHDGQGTSSVTIELGSEFLELLYPDDAVPVSPGLEVAAEKFRKKSEWRETGYSPFGVGLRRTARAPAEFPFPVWTVSAAWMPAGASIEMLTPREMKTAVSLFIPPLHPGEEIDPALSLHPNGARRLTGVRLVAPDADGLPPAAGYLADLGVASFELGAEWLLEVTLDEGRQRVTRDLRPELPVVLRY
jgi:glyoxalase-like protein